MSLNVINGIDVNPLEEKVLNKISELTPDHEVYKVHIVPYGMYVMLTEDGCLSFKTIRKIGRMFGYKESYITTHSEDCPAISYHAKNQQIIPKEVLNL